MRLPVSGRLPTRAHATDAGWDLYAETGGVVPGLTELLRYQRDLFVQTLEANSDQLLIASRLKEIDFSLIHVNIETGTAVEIPPGWVGIVHDRSGLGNRRIKLFGRVIDAGYRDTIKVMATNFGERWEIAAGDRVAQLILYPITDLEPVLSALSESERGTQGLGSTGR